MFLRGFTWGTITSFASILGYNYFTGSYDIVGDIFKHMQTENIPENRGSVESSKNILKYGVPDQGSYIRYYTNHVLSYNQAKRTPMWVAERITKASLEGPGNRKHVKFKPDPAVPSMFNVDNSDYLGSGWSRGHMAPAGDNRVSQDAMEDTFYLSNIVPQNLDNNGGFWNRLEMYCRDLTERFSSVQIFSGPLTLSTEEKDGVHIVQYQVIGESKVAVPTHLYKLIIVDDSNGNAVAMGAFIVPNEPIGFEHELTEYQVTLDELESKTGVVFTPKLDTSELYDLCRVDSCKLVNKKTFDKYFIGRRLSGAGSIDYLNQVWSEFDKRNIERDEWHRKVYQEKMQEFLQQEAESDRSSQSG